MPRPVLVRNSRRVVGKKGRGWFEAMGKAVLAKLVFGRLQECDRGAADAPQALFFVGAPGGENLAIGTGRKNYPRRSVSIKNVPLRCPNEI